MNLAIVILLTFAATLLASHFWPKAWAWLQKREPRLVDELRAIEGEAEKGAAAVKAEAAHLASSILHHNQHHLAAAEAVVSEGAHFVGEAEQNIVAKLQGLLSAKDAQIAQLTQRAQQAEAERDAANQNHAEMLNQLGGIVGA